jgi:cytochrome c553
MKRGVPTPAWLAVAAAFGLLAGCQKHGTDAGSAAGSASSAPSSAAPASAAASGPLIPPMAASAPTDAMRSAGQQIANGQASTAACASCHGAQGEGNAASGFPRIAGQSYAYLLHELESYANDSRKNAVMSPIAKALQPAQRTQVAAYYASLAPMVAAAGASAPAAPASGVPGNVKRGEQLAVVGDETKLVQACANCHGPGGSGEGPGIPYLAGQHAAYLVSALNGWRDGSRNNDPTGQMPVIAKSLADGDAQALAAYFAQQPLPAQPRDVTLASGAASAPAGAASRVVSGPRPAASGGAPQGLGTEQGAPTTGGAQGPGGGGGGSGSGSTGSTSGAAAPAASGASGG